MADTSQIRPWPVVALPSKPPPLLQAMRPAGDLPQRQQVQAPAPVSTQAGDQQQQSGPASAAPQPPRLAAWPESVTPPSPPSALSFNTSEIPPLPAALAYPQLEAPPLPPALLHPSADLPPLPAALRTPQYRADAPAAGEASWPQSAEQPPPPLPLAFTAAGPAPLPPPPTFGAAEPPPPSALSAPSLLEPQPPPALPEALRFPLADVPVPPAPSWERPQEPPPPLPDALRFPAASLPGQAPPQLPPALLSPSLAFPDVYPAAPAPASLPGITAATREPAPPPAPFTPGRIEPLPQLPEASLGGGAGLGQVAALLEEIRDGLGAKSMPQQAGQGVSRDARPVGEPVRLPWEPSRPFPSPGPADSAPVSSPSIGLSQTRMR